MIAPRSFRDETVLVRGPNWLGDLVMATPGFRALRAGLPEARLVLHVRPGLEGLLEGSPFFDEILPVASYHRGLTALRAEGRALRQREFSLGVCIPESFSSALLMREAGVARRFGFGGALRSGLLTDPVPVPASWGRRRLVSRERFVLELVQQVGCRGDDIELELHTSQEQEQAAQQVLSEGFGGEDGPLVVMAPGAGYGAAKCWPEVRFVELGNGLAAAGARLVLVGTASERAVCGRIATAVEGARVDLAGTLGLGVLKAVIRRAALLVCNDSGTRHIATALGVPSFVLFGPTSLAKTNANLQQTTVFERDERCRPCYLRTCPIDHRCLERIPANTLLEQALARVFRSESPGAIS